MHDAALGAAIVTTALLLVPRPSAAQSPEPAKTGQQDGEQVLLVYQASAPADCPTQSEFEAEVTKLTSKAHFSQQRGARRVRVELDSRAGDVRGRLITGDGTHPASREVRGKDCREVGSALAIAVALTIDPEALGPGGSEPVADAPTEQAPEPRPVPPGPPTPRAPRPIRPEPRAPAGKWRWGLGVGLTLESAWAPQMRPGPHAYALLGIGDRLRVSLGITRFFAREVDSVSFGGWFGHGSLSWNLAVLGVLRPFAMLGFEAGTVAASGSGLATSVAAQRPWQAGSAGLGLRFELEDVFLQLGGSALVPISRQRYQVSDPRGEVRRIYEVPPLGLKQETSLGVFL